MATTTPNPSTEGPPEPLGDGELTEHAPPSGDDWGDEPSDPADSEPGADSDSGEGAIPMAPEEAARDVLGELGELDRAAAATSHRTDPLDVGAGLPADPLDFTKGLGLSRGYDGGRSAAHAASGPVRRLETLEDLYAEFPELGTGEYILRVNRDSPSKMGLRPCAGFQADLTRPISMVDFQRRFGGGTYTVLVLGAKTGEMDGRGNYQPRTLAQITLKMPGQPRLPGDDDEDTMATSRYGRAEHPEVERTRLTLDSRREETLFKENRAAQERILALTQKANQGPDLSQLREYSREQIEYLQQQHQETVHLLRTDIEDKRRECDRLGAALENQKQAYVELERKYQNEVFNERSARIEAAQKEETQKIRDLKELHQQQLAAAERNYREQIEKLAQEHQRAMGATQERFDAERRDMVDRHERALAQQSNESARQIEHIEKQFRQQIEHSDRMYEARLQELERGNEREMRAMRESHQNQIQSLKLAEESKTTATSVTANSEVNMHRMRAQTLESEAAALRSENERLRDELLSQHKGPLEAFRDAKELVDAFGGGGAEPAADWKSNVVQALRGFSDKLPDVLKQVNETREHNRAVNVAQQQRGMVAAAGQHRMMAPSGPPQARPAPPPMRRARPRPAPGMPDPEGAPGGYDPDGPPPAYAASPLGHSGADGAPSASPMGGTPPAPHDYYIDPVEVAQYDDRPAELPQQQPAPQQRQQVPAPSPRQHHQQNQQNHPALQQAPEAPSPQPKQAAPRQPPAPPQHQPSRPPPPSPQQAQAQAPAPQPAAAAAPEISDEMLAALAEDGRVVELVQELAQAEQNPLIGPKSFATQFIAEAGDDVARTFVGQMHSPEAFVNVLQKAGVPYKNLYTHAGREYVAEVWVHLLEQLG